MKKKRISLILVMLAAFAFAGYSIASAFLSPNLVLKEEKGLSDSSFIEVRAQAEGDVFYLGDAISYFIEVEYNPAEVEEIDQKSLGRNAILEPFEIREKKEKDFQVDLNTRMHLREYTLQMLDGKVNHLYTFPTITMRYKLRDSGWFERMIIPQPIFIGAKVPIDARGISLKPLKGEVVNMDRKMMPWMFWGLGLLCGTLGVSKIFKIIRKRRKGRKDSQKRMEGLEDLFKAYKGLLRREALTKEDLRDILNQAHQILRALLARREGINWLNPEIDKIPQEIRRSVTDLLKKSQKAYQREDPEQKDTGDVLEELGKIFNFYTGTEKGEV